MKLRDLISPKAMETYLYSQNLNELSEAKEHQLKKIGIETQKVITKEQKKYYEMLVINREKLNKII